MSFAPPEGWTRVRTLEVHTAGEPLRIVLDGVAEIPGSSMLEKRRYAEAQLDGLRRALMLEPRGHADMYGCILTAPVTADGDLGVLFLHNAGWSTMCGHGIIGLVHAGLACGLLPAELAERPILLDTPAGRVVARAELSNGRAQRVRFENVPSFVVGTGLAAEVEGLGSVVFDLAFGGAFYAYVDAAPLGVRIEAEQHRALLDLGVRIKKAVAAQHPVAHPAGEPDLDFLYGVILHQRGQGAAHSRNVCVFADGEVDRSPTGTGVSGRAALLHAAGELDLGDWIRIESLLGTAFEVRALAESSVGGRPAIVPEVAGRAWLTGRNELWIDPEDPLREGFLLR